MSTSPSASPWSRRRSVGTTLLRICTLAVSVAAVTVVTGASGAGAATSPPPTSAPTTTAVSTTPATTTPATTTYRPTTTTTPCVTLTYISYAPGQVVSNWTFEDGRIPYGMNANGSATLSVDPAAARSGSLGLTVSGLSSTSQLTFAVPSYSVGTYQITAWIRFAPGEPSRPVVLRLNDRSVYSTPSSTTFSSLEGYFIPGTSVLNGCGGPVTIGKAVTVVLQLAQIACGSSPSTTAYLDDVSVVYRGTGTVPPPVASFPAAACPPPTTTTTTSSTTTTTTTSPTTTTTTGNSPYSCKATYALTSSWPGGWQASLTVRNTGSLPFTDWVLDWTAPTGSTVSQLWPTTFTQAGTEVRVPAPSWSPNLAPGSSFTVGYLGSGSSAAPSDVRVDGVACSG